MNQWASVKLKDVCTQVTVGFVGSMADEYCEEGVPFLRSLNIQPFRINTNDLKYISQAFHERIKKSTLRPGDVGIVRTGYPGTACVVPRWLEEANCSDLVIVRPGPGLNPYFLAALFNSSFGRDLVGGNLVGAAQQHFNVTVAKELKLLLPPRKEQDKIAAILCAYDDLMANNQRRIALLEGMAEEIYREWFVRMRFPGSPTTLIQNGVPAGWTKKKLPEIAVITYGFPFTGDRFNDVGIGKPIIRIRDVLQGSSSDYTDEVGPDKCVVEAGDLLIGMDGEFHMNHWVGEEAWLVQRVCKVEAKDERLRGYLARALRAPINHYQQTIVGATVGHLGAKHLTAIDVLMPPPSVDLALTTLNNLLDQKLALSKHSLQLARTRDALLPRLISGKLKVDHLDIRLPPSMRAEAEATA